MNPLSTSRLLLVITALLFSTGGAAIKATSLGAWQVVGLRSGIAAVALLLLVPASRRGWGWHVIPPAIAYAAMLILYVNATKLTTAANAIFLQSTSPLWVLVLGPVVLKEHLRRADLLFAMAVGCGLTLFFVSHQSAAATAPDPATGNILAALSGIAWGFTLISLRWLGRGSKDADSALASVVLGNLFAFFFAAPMAFPVGHTGIGDWAIIFYLGVIQVGLAYLLLARAMRHIPAFEATTLLLLEPVCNPIWAWMVHGERPVAMALCGGGVILTATFVHTWIESRTRAA